LETEKLPPHNGGQAIETLVATVFSFRWRLFFIELEDEETAEFLMAALPTT